MKYIKLFLLGAVLLNLSFTAQAQSKYAVINTKYILDRIPEYKEADKKLKAEQFMLSEDLRKKREDELFMKEKALRDLQKKRFGYEGDLFKERQKLVKPIQDRVYNAAQKMATARSYDFILDKSEGITIIFADPKLDKSDDILKELGVINN